MTVAQPLFLETLSKFVVALPERYDHAAVLGPVTESVTAVLGLSGSAATGVPMAEGGRLRFVSAVSQTVHATESTRTNKPARSSRILCGG